MNDLAKTFSNGQFELAIEPHPVDGFRVQAPGLAKALGFRDAYNLLVSVPESEKGYTLVSTLGGEQKITYITERGFYRVLGQRQAARIQDQAIRAQVEAFQDWVYGDVLPSIRLTGGYGLDARNVAELVSKADLARMVLESEEEKKAIAKELQAAAPKVAYHDRFVAESDVVKIAEWGQQFELSRAQSFDLLRAKDFIYKMSHGKHWSNTKNSMVEDFEHRARQGKKTYAFFELRPHHAANRLYNGQVRQTLYIRQAYALDLAKACGLTASELVQMVA